MATSSIRLWEPANTYVDLECWAEAIPEMNLPLAVETGQYGDEYASIPSNEDQQMGRPRRLALQFSALDILTLDSTGNLPLVRWLDSFVRDARSVLEIYVRAHAEDPDTDLNQIFSYRCVCLDIPGWLYGGLHSSIARTDVLQMLFIVNRWSTVGTYATAPDGGGNLTTIWEAE